MNENQINKIIQSETWEESKREDRWYYLSGYVPSFVLILTGIPLLPFVKKAENLELIYSYLGVTLGVILFIYTYYAFKNEKKLVKFTTNLNREKNSEIIKLVSNEFEFNNYKLYTEFFTPYLFLNLINSKNKFKTHRVILIASEKEILINIKNLGGLYGRTPYSFGFNHYWKNKIVKKIKHYAQQQLKVMA
jgi:hypothetical protein